MRRINSVLTSTANSKHRHRRLKPLLDNVPPGFVVDTAWLTAQGIDSKSIHRYVSQGWLERVVRGVYRRPMPRGTLGNDTISWESVLVSLQQILDHDVHLGGESALELAGFHHYLYLRGAPRVHFYGAVPPWVKRLPLRTKMCIHPRSLFCVDQLGIEGLGRDVEMYERTIEIWRWPIFTSSPERAILEACDLVRTPSEFENLDKIFQSLTALRPHLLMELLVACRSIKVKRLFFVFAENNAHDWFKHLDASLINFGSGPRALVDDGRIHPVYQIAVPREFVPDRDVVGVVDA